MIKKIFIGLLTMVLIMSFCTVLAHAEEMEQLSQVTFTADVPEEFGLSMYAVIMDIETGETYNVPILKPNGYTGYVMVPPGQYQVCETAVYEDYAGNYALNADVSTIDAVAGTNYTVMLKLADEEAIEAVIKERTQPDDAVVSEAPEAPETADNDVTEAPQKPDEVNDTYAPKPSDIEPEQVDEAVTDTEIESNQKPYVLYILLGIVAVGGIGFIVWRTRSR